jgi:hypothetical protein
MPAEIELMTHEGTTFTAAPCDDAPKGSVAANVSFTLPQGGRYGRSFVMAVSNAAQCHDRPNAVARAMLKAYNRLTGFGLDIEAHYPEIARKIRNLLLSNAR